MEGFTPISNYFLKTLASLSLLSPKCFWHLWEVSETKCGLIPLIHYKAMFGTSLNSIFHFWHFNSLFHFHYYLIHLVLKLILIRPLGPYLQISKFAIFHLVLKLILIRPLGPHLQISKFAIFYSGLFPGLISFLFLAYNI